MSERLEETPIMLFLGCLLGQTALAGGLGIALVIFANDRLVPVGIGLGMVGYAIAVVVFTLISLWRGRRASR